MQNTVPNNYKQIADLAFQLWDSNGRPQGRDQEFWFQAEAQILAAPSSNVATARQREDGRTTVAQSAPAKSNSSHPQTKETVVLKSLSAIPQSGNARPAGSRG